MFCSFEVIVSFFRNIVYGLIIRNILPLLSYKTKLYRLKTKQKTSPYHSTMETVPRIAYYFLLQPQRYKIMEFEAGERKSSCCWIFIILQYFYLLYPSYLARFICVVSFSLNVFSPSLFLLLAPLP